MKRLRISAIWVKAMLAAILPIGNVYGLIDLNGNLLSDLWELRYEASDLLAEDDTDGDGYSNLEESAAGTNPFDADSYFAITSLDLLPEGSPQITWNSVAGQVYIVQSSDDAVEWEEEAVLGLGGAMQYAFEPVVDLTLARVMIPEDSDLDGLNDFEEFLLGYDAYDPSSAGVGTGGDMASAVALLASGEAFMLGDRQVSGALPTEEQASRFLMQASLGASRDDVSRLSSMGYEAWIDDQFDEEPGLMEPEIDARIEAELNVYESHRHSAWWTQIITSDDLLRQRMAVALSEIYVISDQGAVGVYEEGMSNYYDTLLQAAFGNWRDLLYDVTMHPMMGIYLSHMRNRKADPEANRFPDENYAREVMQLFSIGLFELREDGSQILDSGGYPIPTYDNDDITNFARVFTGFSWGGPEVSEDDFIDFFIGESEPDEPMKVWPDEHDQDAKTLLRGTTLPAFADSPGREPMDDVNDALDNLFEHPNVGPFMARLLIQRLVKSNPSPEYIRRVAMAFADDGSGERGNMEAVIKAILLDGEARSVAAFDDPASGRLREPYLRWVRFIRTFPPVSETGSYYMPVWNAQEELGQRFLSSPTVFNFFLPDYAPVGPINDAGLVAPEFQILTSTLAISSQNYYQGRIYWGFCGCSEEEETLTLDVSSLVPLASDPEALIDEIDLLLTYGQLSDETREILVEAYDELPGWFDDEARARVMLRLVYFSPDFAIFQ